MSEECQDTIRWLLIVQIVLIWYWSQSTTGVITLDSFYKYSIFWSLYIAESEHKDSLNRGFLESNQTSQNIPNLFVRNLGKNQTLNTSKLRVFWHLLPKPNYRPTWALQKFLKFEPALIKNQKEVWHKNWQWKY